MGWGRLEGGIIIVGWVRQSPNQLHSPRNQTLFLAQREPNPIGYRLLHLSTHLRYRAYQGTADYLEVQEELCSGVRGHREEEG